MMEAIIKNLRYEVKQPSAPAFSILDIDYLELKPSKLIGISGHSGSGKTTLLHCLAGVVRPSHGEIFWNKIDITTLTSQQNDHWRLQNLGLVFQNFQLIPEISILENIMVQRLFTRWRFSAKDKMRAEELAKMFHLDKLTHRISVLSRGEQQRVAIARALFNQPKLILADEPTASLDKENAAIVMQALQDYNNNFQTTIVVTSHDPAILNLMSYTLTLNKGKFVNRNINEAQI